MDFHGFESSGDRMSDMLWHPVPPCATLCLPVASCRAGLDPPNIKISDSGGLDLESWCLDAGCRQDWNGLEEVTEGIGMEGGDWKKFSHARASGARRMKRRLGLNRIPQKQCSTTCKIQSIRVLKFQGSTFSIH